MLNMTNTFNQSAASANNDPAAPLTISEVLPGSERGEQPPLVEHAYKPFDQESALRESPYRPYSNQPGLHQPPYEPYKGI